MLGSVDRSPSDVERTDLCSFWQPRVQLLDPRQNLFRNLDKTLAHNALLHPSLLTRRHLHGSPSDSSSSSSPAPGAGSTVDAEWLASTW